MSGLGIMDLVSQLQPSNKSHDTDAACPTGTAVRSHHSQTVDETSLYHYFGLSL